MNPPINAPAVTIGNAQLPKEGPKCLPYQLDFSVNLSYTIAVSDLMSKGPGFAGLSVIQGMWIDNSQSIVPFIASISGTGQIIRAAPGVQGYYPLLSPSLGNIVFSSASGIVINVDIYNVPLPAATWATGASTFSFVVGGTANGALKTSDVILDALATVNGLKVVSNPSTVFTGTNAAVTNAAAVHLITAGADLGGVITNNDLAGILYLDGTNTVSNTSFALQPGQSFNLDNFTGDIWAKASIATINVSIGKFA